MRKLFFQSVLFVLGVMMLPVSCRKESEPVVVATPPATNPVINPVLDPPANHGLMLLKEMNVSSLPSPYYQFVYDAAGLATRINFASGFFQYTLEYENGRVKKMVNAPNKDYLLYQYTGSLVTAIDIFAGRTGQKKWHHDFTYDQQQRLIKAEWFSYPDGVTSIRERKAEMEYTPAGDNLLLMRNYHKTETGELALGATYTFDDYDDKVNIGDFDLLKQFFDHFLYLPGINLQKNNPRFMRISTTETELETANSYTYKDNLPQLKTSTFRYTRGSQAGLVTGGTTAYSYY